MSAHTAAAQSAATSAAASAAAATPGRARIAADIGGTFTDLVLEWGAAAGEAPQRHSCKVLTTPRAPEQGVMQGIAHLLEETGLAPADVGLVIHGTTLATNALIERKGARTALLTTGGFRDVLEMGYEKRFEQYDVNIERAPELVPRPLRFTVPERTAADGTVLVPLDEAAVRRAAEAMAAAGVQAVAVGFLHAYAWPAHERRAREIVQQVLGPRVTVCLSSEVCPEMREYERLSTTAANAYVRPLMAGYLGRLRAQLDAAGLAVPLLLMMSGGGVTTLELAEHFPIRLVESGPAGGAILAAQLARELAPEGAQPLDVMAFDMGGTTAKVCLIAGGEPERARRFEIGRAYRNLKGSGLPVRVPVIELVEIGAGGGSIGRVDALGRITAGPDSAGAEPGPACYGRGGSAPTVTDANLVLGRIDGQRFAAGRMPLDAAAAHTALEGGVGAALGLDAFWSAAGLSEIVEENMANAARVHAVERGIAPEDHAMIAFGGAAPLHAARVATKLGISRIVVPAGAGVGSAIGFLRAPIAFEVVRSDVRLLSGADGQALDARLAEMEAGARAVVEPAAAIMATHAPGAATSNTKPRLRVERLVELRYQGQGHELRVPVPAGALDASAIRHLRDDFEAAYRRTYGLVIPGAAVEIVTWSVTVSTPAPAVQRALPPSAAPARVAPPGGERIAWDPEAGAAIAFATHWRFDLAPGQGVSGPAIITEHETSTVVPPGWSAQLDSQGHLHLQRERAT
ncbi:MAG: hydantoinase/oxoprolinase family protein [Rubrivivax sp.]|nr:hydantoinase/oxoprolinase family protein [Rubrivivax sp.]